MVFLVIIHTAVIMVAVEATKREFRINSILGFRAVGIVTSVRNQFADFFLRDFFWRIDYFEILR